MFYLIKLNCKALECTVQLVFDIVVVVVFRWGGGVGYTVLGLAINCINLQFFFFTFYFVVYAISPNTISTEAHCRSDWGGVP